MLSELVELANNSKATSEEENKNQIFELPERIDLPTQTGDFLYAYPEMRRGWDSNPRGAFTPRSFQDFRTRPLCDPSLAEGTGFEPVDAFRRRGLAIRSITTLATLQYA